MNVVLRVVKVTVEFVWGGGGDGGFAQPNYSVEVVFRLVVVGVVTT